MVQISSIGKQIATWVYEDATKKKIATIPNATFVDDSQKLYWSWIQQTTPVVQKKIATTAEPVITRSAPAPTSMTPPVTDINSWDDNQIKDYVTRAELNPWQLSQEDLFKLRRGQQIMADRAYQQTTIDPYKEQIIREEQLRKQREEELKAQSQQIIDAKRRELELTYWKRIAWEQEAGQNTMSAAQWALSFSWFWRSTYAAEKQAEIQNKVNENINILNAERDYAIAKYEAELRWADAEVLANYDKNIASLRQRSAEFSAQLAQQMNEYNLQTVASYEEKINNVLQLAQSMQNVELTPWQRQEANAYASLLLDNEGNINEKMLADIPSQLKWYALKRAAEMKASMPKKMEAPKTASDGVWNLYSFNEETGDREIIGKGKSQVQLEEITLPDGTKQTVQFDPTTGATTPVMWWTTWDLRWLANQFPWQARAKNNNPAGITWNSNFDNGKWTAALLQAAGINYEKWTPRPSGEWWNYVSFPTIEDWLAAQRILMTQTYWDSTVQQMLGKWVWTGEALNYAKQVAWNAWVPLNVKVNKLDEQQLSALQMAKIQKESPWLAKLLWRQAEWQAVFDPNKAPQYINYIESGKLPTGMKSWTPQANKFIAEAWDWYIDAKSKDLQQKWFTISNAEAFKNVDSKTLEAVNKAIAQVPAFEKAMDDIIKLVEKSWTEFPISSKGREINQKIRNAQLIAKEIYNLWVLNWPDLALMESIIANPATRTSKLEWTFVDYKDLLKKWKETILWNAYAQAQNIWLSPISKTTKYTPNTDYPTWTIVEKDWIMYLVWQDGNFYEQ